MHGECYAGTPLPSLRSDGGDRTLLVTLLLSIAAHLLFWQQLEVGRHPLATATADTTFAITLLPSPTPPAPTQAAARGHIAASPRQEVAAPQEEHTAARDNKELSSSPLESAGAVTALAASEPLVPPRHDAAYLHNPEPGYPLVARRRHLEGTVVIRAQIGTQGECLQTELHRSSGHTILDQAALDAVAQWRFVPARRGSETIVAWVDVPITFHLTATR